tara:strand:- start:391 stop:2826 length:2436 start_codon:yes stop_codon:yes gene_type:complete
MHEYVREWWESKVFKGHEKSEENLKKFEDHFGSRDTFSKRMEDRDNLRDGQNFAFVLPKVGRKKSLQMINFIAEQTRLNKEKGDGHIIKNLWVPEIVNVDYSEYVDEPMYKGALFAKHYKDGILIVNHPLKGNEGCAFFEIAGVGDENTTPAGKSVFSIFKESFSNYGQIDWNHKNFDEKVVVYVVQPKVSKNTAARLVFKNNKAMDKLLKYLRKGDYTTLVYNPPKDFKDFFIKRTYDTEFIGLLKLKDNKERPIKNIIVDETSKKDCLKTSCAVEILALYNEYHSTSIDSKSRREEPKNLLEKPLFFDELRRLNTFDKIKNYYMQEIFDHEKNIDIFDIAGEKDDKTYEKRITTHLKKVIVKAALLYHCVNDGLTFCDSRPINYEKKSKTDCLLFWYQIQPSELIFNVLNENNFPLCMKNSTIINDAYPSDESVVNELDVTVDYDNFMKEAYKHQKIFEFKNKHIIEEAMNSPLGYTMPYDGVFEILHDMVFSFIKFREYQDYITIVVSDDNERYFFEVFDKKQKDFKYFLWNNLKLNDNYSEDCIQDIYTKLATCIRDAKVLIERDSTMQYRGRRSPSNCKTNSVYHVYFPKVRYRRSSDVTQTKKEKDFFNESRKFSGTRRAHIRRLVSDQKPSKKQLLLAKRLDIWIPNGHTFVRESEWGSTMTKREIRYRNTALNGVFYYDTKEISEAQKINELGPLGFEEYCREHVKKLGYEVKTCQNYDGGIDIRAMKVLDNLETEYLIVQCKHWKTPIPPNEMRAFKTACDEEHSDYKKVKMFITSSRFSPSAKELANKHNIIMIDGDDLIK